MSTEDVAAVVRLAGDHGVTLLPTSTGHNVGRGEFSPVRDGQVVLHLGRRMNRILVVDERLGYALVEPGVTFRELRAELARGRPPQPLRQQSGVGPLLDGPFAQSDFGIITQAAIWLMPRPPVIPAFSFAFPEDRDLAEIVELIRRSI